MGVGAGDHDHVVSPQAMIASEDVGCKVRTRHVPYVPIASGVGPGYEDPDFVPHDGVFSSFEVEGILSHAVGKGKWCDGEGGEEHPRNATA